MTTELIVLVLVAFWTLVQVFLTSGASTPSQPKGWNAGPRDEPISLSTRAQRLQRALHNHYETLPLFIIAVLVTVISGQSTPLTAACSWIYLCARVAYVPAYALGLSPWRSLIWMIGTLAIVIMLGAALI